MWNYKMKILITSLLFFTIFCLIVIEYSYAQETGTNATETTQGFETTGGAPLLAGATPFRQTPEVFVQIIFRDSAGTLVGYVEGKPDILVSSPLIDFLEPRSEKSTMIKNGKSFEIMKYADRLSWPDIQQVQGGYFLRLTVSGESFYGLYFSHELYLISPGDTGQLLVTVVR